MSLLIQIATGSSILFILGIKKTWGKTQGPPWGVIFILAVGMLILRLQRLGYAEYPLFLFRDFCVYPDWRELLACTISQKVEMTKIPRMVALFMVFGGYGFFCCSSSSDLFFEDPVGRTYPDISKCDKYFVSCGWFG